MKTALFWEYNSKTEKVHCHLCPHYCKISTGQAGICRVRVNHQGRLYAENYGKISSIALDPIEKKPLYHYKPGTYILSIGTYGCNLRCGYCQNYTISQQKVSTRYFEPESIPQLIKQFENNIGIAFTYNEPFIWYEYVYDTARLIKENNPETSIVLVSNGYVNPKPLEKLLPYLDALNIDLKSFRQETYRKLCKSDLEPVLNTIKNAVKSCHVEVTTLVITNENDSPEEIREIAEFLGDINPDIPLHLSRYYPNYLLTNPATPAATLMKAKEIAEEYLNYVYLGNLPEADTNTYCPKCDMLLVDRKYYQTKVLLKTSHCSKCDKEIALRL